MHPSAADRSAGAASTPRRCPCDARRGRRSRPRSSANPRCRAPTASPACPPIARRGAAHRSKAVRHRCGEWKRCRPRIGRRDPARCPRAPPAIDRPARGAPATPSATTAGGFDRRSTRRPSRSARSNRASVNSAGNDPPRPDSFTWPAVSRSVNRSIHARPGAVLPITSTATASASTKQIAAPALQREILTARRIRTPGRVRCRPRRHRGWGSASPARQYPI